MTETRTEWRVAYEHKATWLGQHDWQATVHPHCWDCGEDTAGFVLLKDAEDLVALLRQRKRRNVRIQQRTVTEWADA